MDGQWLSELAENRISEACNIARAATAMRHITVYMSHRSDNTQTASCIVAQNQ